MIRRRKSSRRSPLPLNSRYYPRGAGRDIRLASQFFKEMSNVPDLTHFKRAKDVIGLDKFEGYTDPTISAKFDGLLETEMVVYDFEEFHITSDGEDVTGIRFRFQVQDSDDMFTTLVYSQVVREQMAELAAHLPVVIKPMQRGSGDGKYFTINN